MIEILCTQLSLRSLCAYIYSICITNYKVYPFDIKVKYLTTVFVGISAGQLAFCLAGDGANSTPVNPEDGFAGREYDSEDGFFSEFNIYTE